MMLLQSAFLHVPKYYANLALYKWLSACLAAKKQQSSLRAPWAKVCNENRSTAITQNVCLSTHREPHVQDFSCIILMRLYSSSISLCAKWGHATCLGLERRAKGERGRRMLWENTVCPQRVWRSEFQIHCKERAVCDGLLLLSFVISLKPRRTTKVKQTWLNLVKIPHCAPV